MSNFVDCERDQAFLLPPDLRDWIPGDDLAHFVIEAVERVGMSAFKVNHRGTGSAQYHPRKVCQINSLMIARPPDTIGECRKSHIGATAFTPTLSAEPFGFTFASR